jgi:hypothetical protein
MDGYNFLSEDGYNILQNLMNRQIEINNAIDSINSEMNEMKIPASMDEWIDSLNVDGFKLSDFKKSVMNVKVLNKLIEERSNNSSNLKLAIIDNIIERINIILK